MELDAMSTIMMELNLEHRNSCIECVSFTYHDVPTFSCFKLSLSTAKISVTMFSSVAIEGMLPPLWRHQICRGRFAIFGRILVELEVTPSGLRGGQ
ncbi:hypothetical protein ACJRO7_034319 [Eucalyptus globulus]|uniref:Uncharacterized protein n=1 Tax=Eucalyptus globulus TaxID=34317 RepID=A0ABD3J2P7_EUCGL